MWLLFQSVGVFLRTAGYYVAQDICWESAKNRNSWIRAVSKKILFAGHSDTSDLAKCDETVSYVKGVNVAYY